MSLTAHEQIDVHATTNNPLIQPDGRHGARAEHGMNGRTFAATIDLRILVAVLFFRLQHAWRCLHEFIRRQPTSLSCKTDKVERR